MGKDAGQQTAERFDAPARHDKQTYDSTAFIIIDDGLHDRVTGGHLEH